MAIIIFIIIIVTTDMTSTRSKSKIEDDLTVAVRRGVNTDSRTLKVKFIDEEIGKSYL